MFSKDNQPPKGPRGRSFKNKLLDVIKENSLIDCSVNDSKETTEKVFLKHIAVRAFDRDDNQSHTLLRELLSKSYPTLKATMDTFNFELSEDSTSSEKAEAILMAISNGNIPPDVGSMLIQAAKSVVDIEMATDLKERIEALEKLYDCASETN